MSPIETELQGKDELADELFDLDLRETTVVATVMSANTATCNTCGCPSSNATCGGCP